MGFVILLTVLKFSIYVLKFLGIRLPFLKMCCLHVRRETKCHKCQSVWFKLVNLSVYTFQCKSASSKKAPLTYFDTFFNKHINFIPKNTCAIKLWLVLHHNIVWICLLTENIQNYFMLVNFKIWLQLWMWILLLLLLWLFNSTERCLYLYQINPSIRPN